MNEVDPRIRFVIDGYSIDFSFDDAVELVSVNPSLAVDLYRITRVGKETFLQCASRLGITVVVPCANINNLVIRVIAGRIGLDAAMSTIETKMDKKAFLYKLIQSTRTRLNDTTSRAERLRLLELTDVAAEFVDEMDRSINFKEIATPKYEGSFPKI